MQLQFAHDRLFTKRVGGGGIDISKSTDAVSFFEELAGCLPALVENRYFISAIGISNYYYNALENSGIKLVDYEHKMVLPDEETFKAFCEVYKPYWDMDTQEVTTIYSPERIFDGSFLFAWLVTPADSIGLLGRSKIKDIEAVVSTMPSAAGGSWAVVETALAINANSRDQLNAWNFIKVMLSALVQGVTSRNGVYHWPVNRQALKRTTDAYIAQDHWSDDDKIPWRLTKEEASVINDMPDGITGCGLWDSGDLWRIFRDCMTPYFKDEKSYDECAAELRSKLALYVSE